MYKNRKGNCRAREEGTNESRLACSAAKTGKVERQTLQKGLAASQRVGERHLEKGGTARRDKDRLAPTHSRDQRRREKRYRVMLPRDEKPIAKEVNVAKDLPTQAASLPCNGIIDVGCHDNNRGKELIRLKGSGEKHFEHRQKWSGRRGLIN